MVDFVVRDYLAVKEAKVRVSGLTVVRGESYSGKSSLFRAIEAAMTNRFASGCVRWDAPACSVSIRFDGVDPVLKVVKTEKGGAVYELGSERYEKVRRDVPLEVQEFLGCDYLRAGSDTLSLNFWEQFSKPLLWCFSQAKISEMLGNGAALREWSDTNKKLTSRRSELKGAEGVLRHQVDTCASQLSSWSLLEESGRALYQEVGATVSSYKSGVAQLDRLKLLRRWVLDLSSVQEGLSCYDALLRGLDSVSVEARLLATLHDLHSVLTELQSLDSVDRILRQGVQYYRALQDVVSSREFVTFDRLRALRLVLLRAESCDASLQSCRSMLRVAGLERLKQYCGLCSEVGSLVSSCSGMITVYKKLDLDMRLRSLLQDLQQVEADTRSVEGLLGNSVCPFCGSVLNV